jgi:hypothetical protein
MACRADTRGPASRMTMLAAALALAGLNGTAGAAGNGNAELLAEIRKLSERMERIEQRNRELEKKLEDGKAAEQRLKALEAQHAEAEKALATERLSENEPELVTRLKAVEFQALSMQKQARQIDALDGITVGASITGVVQQANRNGTATGERESRANYRGDVSVTLPGGKMGNMEGKIFTHFRFGQGNGVGLRTAYTSTPNTTAFQTNAGADDSFAILAQGWYQLTVPLPIDGYKPHSKERLEFNFGKIDPFVFFDQNAAADDESSRFLNNAFVHNPLLDSGGDTGADAYGFAPGARLAYVSEKNKPETWGASVGVFGSGSGANFSGSPGQPFVIAQLETSRRFFSGLAGNYRAYLWRNGRTTDFNSVSDHHSGWGVSADQRVGDAVTLLGRYGHQMKGKTRFDRALTLGAEIGGNYWGRSADAVGIAAGFLRTGSDYRDATADTTLAGYAASGTERIGELYYRYRVNNRFDLTPDFQLIQRAGGDGSAPAVKVVGLRAKIGF